MFRKVSVVFCVVISIIALSVSLAAAGTPVIREKGQKTVPTPAPTPAPAPVYKIDGGSNYVALQDHFMVVNLDDDVTVGIQLIAGTSFSTQEMYQISRGFDAPVSAQTYQSAMLQRKAMGANGATLVVKKLNQDIQAIKTDDAKAREWKARHPDLVEHLRRGGDQTLKHEGDRLFRELVRDDVDRIIWRNRW